MRFVLAAALCAAISGSDVMLQEKGGRWTGLVDAAFSQRSADARDLGTAFYTLRPDVDRTARGKAMDTGFTFTKEIAAAPDALEMKIVITDRATGRLGSVIVPLRR